MSYQTALKRLQNLKGHFRPSPEFIKETESATFNLSHAQEKFWATLPSGFFDAIECLKEIKEAQNPAMYFGTMDEWRRDSVDILFQLVNKMFEKGFTSAEKIISNIDKFCFEICSVGMSDLAMITKIMSHTILYCKTLKNLGTERHQKLLKDGVTFKSIGCFCLTELGHGSNAKGLETTAIYDKEYKQFVLNTPTKTATKFWIGNLGKAANHAVVLAQLLIEENGKQVNKGVHAFVLQIRDFQTHTPFPGIEIGECGPKKGLDGIDNGYMKFSNYRVPREALLNRFGDVTEDGEYRTSIESDGKRFATSIMSLSGGRVLITRSSSELTYAALSIAIRYGAVRRQFGETGKETVLLDYPLHQHRLIPRMAEAFVFYIGANNLIQLWDQNQPRLLEKGNVQTEMLHSLSSNMKGLMTSRNHETITECRKACGGHGYSYYANFGQILAYNDVHCTWEGDNDVLLMQCHAFMLKWMKKISAGETAPQTLEFLQLGQFERPEFSGSLDSLEDLTSFIDQIACYTAIKAATKLTSGGDFQESFLKLQKFELRSMCEAYLDSYMMHSFSNFLTTVTDERTIEVFSKLLKLYAFNRFTTAAKTYLPILGEEMFTEVEQKIISLCADLRKEVVLLTHLMPYPTSFAGPLGHEDMQVYDRLIQHYMAFQDVTDKPTWWKKFYTNRTEF